MGFLENLYLNSPIQVSDVILVLLISLIGLPIIYYKTGKTLKLTAKLFAFFFLLVAVYTPIFVTFIFFVFSLNQVLLEFMGLLPESIYYVDEKDIRIATNLLPLTCAVWFITSLIIVIKLGKAFRE